MVFCQNTGKGMVAKGYEALLMGGTMVKKERSEVLRGMTGRRKTGCGNVYVTINEDEDTQSLVECLITIGKSGGCARSWGEALGRLISMNLRLGGSIDEIIKQLQGIGCHKPHLETLSCPDGIAKILIGRQEGLEKKK